MRLRPLHALLVLGVVAVLLLVPLPRPGRVGLALQDLAHVPVGGIVALFVFALLRRRIRRSRLAAAAVAMVLSVALLALVEIVQPYVGRGRSLGDLVTGSLGAASALLVVLAWGRPAFPRALLAAGGLLLLTAGCVPTVRILADAWRQKGALPMLASFEDDLEMTRWWLDDARGTRGGEHTTYGLWSLRVDLEPAAFPSATLAAPYGDWRGYSALAFDVFVEGDEALPLIVKVVDAAHDESYADRFHRKLVLPPGPHSIRIPLEDVEAGPRVRTMDLSAIQSVQWFVDGLDTPRTFHLDGVRLIR